MDYLLTSSARRINGPFLAFNAFVYVLGSIEIVREPRGLAAQAVAA